MPDTIEIPDLARISWVPFPGTGIVTVRREAKLDFGQPKGVYLLTQGLEGLWLGATNCTRRSDLPSGSSSRHVSGECEAQPVWLRV